MRLRQLSLAGLLVVSCSTMGNEDEHSPGAPGGTDAGAAGATSGGDAGGSDTGSNGTGGNGTGGNGTGGNGTGGSDTDGSGVGGSGVGGGGVGGSGVGGSGVGGNGGDRAGAAGQPSANPCEGVTCEAPPPSCVGLAKTCGPAGNADCCASNLVTGGSFNLNNDAALPTTVANFRLDNYEITVGRFRKFVAAYSQTMTASGAGKNPNDASDMGWDTVWNASLPADASALKAALNCSPNRTWTDAAGSAAAESLPINCISWYMAESFCIWDGGRLPGDAQWNYAAAGGAAQREYPWGSQAPDCSYANFFYDGDFCVLASPGTGRVSRVGSESPKGDGLYGQSDLAGNLWEWTQDWCNACAGDKPFTHRTVRGGCYLLYASQILTSYRASGIPQDRLLSFGARCARTQ